MHESDDPEYLAGRMAALEQLQGMVQRMMSGEVASEEPLPDMADAMKGTEGMEDEATEEMEEGEEMAEAAEEAEEGEAAAAPDDDFKKYREDYMKGRRKPQGGEGSLTVLQLSSPKRGPGRPRRN